MSGVNEFLAALQDRLRLSRRHSSRVVLELHDHLEDASLLNAELSDIVQRVGDPQSIATEFNVVAASAATRRLPLLAAISGVSTLVGLNVAARSGLSSTPAGFAAQIAFFVGSLAIGTGLVLGMRSLTCAVRYSRGSTIDVAGRSRIRLNSLGAMWSSVTAAVCFDTAVWLRSPTVKELSAMCAGTVISLTSLVWSARGRSRLCDENSAPVIERTVISRADDFVTSTLRKRAWIVVLPAALVVGLGSMSHAEAPAVTAWPWGLAGAVAVLALFVSLRSLMGFARDH